MQCRSGKAWHSYIAAFAARPPRPLRYSTPVELCPFRNQTAMITIERISILSQTTISLFKNHTMAITKGQQAPDFSLYDDAKNKVTLSDLKGNNVLLLFFPQAFTSTCTKELCGVRDNIAAY